MRYHRREPRRITARPSKAESWSVEQVCFWLTSLSVLAGTVSIFRKAAVKGAHLLRMTVEDMVGMGVTQDQAEQVQKAAVKVSWAVERKKRQQQSWGPLRRKKTLQVRTELSTEDAAKATKELYWDADTKVLRCVCGYPMKCMQAVDAYPGMKGVSCDISSKAIGPLEYVFHCQTGRNKFHEAGYDVAYDVAYQRIFWAIKNTKLASDVAVMPTSEDLMRKGSGDVASSKAEEPKKDAAAVPTIASDADEKTDDTQTKDTLTFEASDAPTTAKDDNASQSATDALAATLAAAKKEAAAREKMFRVISFYDSDSSDEDPWSRNRRYRNSPAAFMMMQQSGRTVFKQTGEAEDVDSDAISSSFNGFEF